MIKLLNNNWVLLLLIIWVISMTIMMAECNKHKTKVKTEEKIELTK